ncbi:hypothetical protein P7K49_030971 [Saguinus oedipus]|uniref:Uncharacterized protein n=1 Tax=Saguinus oedipus TaxID=9490 RepID=A0ABQ9U5Q0_SAGOE|nr:hypothetical protein P7K49_030971 [Saguinus oedipus]
MVGPLPRPDSKLPSVPALSKSFHPTPSEVNLQRQTQSLFLSVPLLCSALSCEASAFPKTPPPRPCGGACPLSLLLLCISRLSENVVNRMKEPSSPPPAPASSMFGLPDGNLRAPHKEVALKASQKQHSHDSVSATQAQSLSRNDVDSCKWGQIRENSVSDLGACPQQPSPDTQVESSCPGPWNDRPWTSRRGS